MLLDGDFPGAYKILMVIQGQRRLLFKNCLIPLAPEQGGMGAGRIQRLTLELQVRMDTWNLKPRAAIFPLGDSTSGDLTGNLHTALTPPKTACALPTPPPDGTSFLCLLSQECSTESTT